jgi:hypothetical protein
MAPAQLLRDRVAAQLPEDAAAWLAQACSRVAAGTDRELFVAIGQVARRVGREPLRLDADDRRAAAAARTGWDPRGWTLDQAARVLLLLSGTLDGAAFQRRLDTLCAAADVGELVAFYRGLPLYPDARRHVRRAAEGVRSNMRVVFEAVAHRNPYPAENFDAGAWNQMVLKALFVGAPLHPIVGLDARANDELARMLCDYAHERWAAARPIAPELWRCVGPFAVGARLEDFRRLLDRGSATERRAAALALTRSPDPAARVLLDAHPELAHAARAGDLDWETLAAAG